MRNVFSWSGGKDSTATLILAHELGIQIDDVIFAEVMYDNIRGISGEEPEFISWVKSIAIPRIEEFIGGEDTHSTCSERLHRLVFSSFHKRQTPRKDAGICNPYALFSE